MVPLIEKIKKTYHLKQLIVVADAVLTAVRICLILKTSAVILLLLKNSEQPPST